VEGLYGLFLFGFSAVSADFPIESVDTAESILWCITLTARRA
jgi:hypothetical protein